MEQRRIACVGGGPGGLFFSLLVKRHRPEWEVVLFERNRPTDAFGFGVVFSDATLRAIDEADPVLRDALHEHGVHWTAIDVLAKGERERFDGNGMAAIRRSTLLGLLQSAARDAGVDLRFQETVADLADLADLADESLERAVRPLLSAGLRRRAAHLRTALLGETAVADSVQIIEDAVSMPSSRHRPARDLRTGAATTR